MKASRLIKQEVVTLDFSDTFPGLPPEETTLHLTVEPSRLTPAKEQELRNAEENSDLLVAFITDVITEWDLLNDDGTTVPLTAEGLKDQPILLLGLIVNGIGEAISAKTDAEGKP